METLAKQLLQMQQMNAREALARVARERRVQDDGISQERQAQGQEARVQAQQLEQILGAFAERIQAGQEQIAAMIQALAGREQPAPVVTVNVPERAVTVNMARHGTTEKIPTRDKMGNIVRVIERELGEQ